MTRIALTGLALLALFLVQAAPVRACAVCYGAADSEMTSGMNNAILFLLAVVGTVQVGFVALFVSFRRRVRRLDELRSRLRVIQGGGR